MAKKVAINPEETLHIEVIYDGAFAQDFAALVYKFFKERDATPGQALGSLGYISGCVILDKLGVDAEYIDYNLKEYARIVRDVVEQMREHYTGDKNSLN